MTALRNHVAFKHHRARVALYLRDLAIPEGSVASRIIEERLSDGIGNQSILAVLVLWASEAAGGVPADAVPVAAAFDLFERFLALHHELSDERAPLVARWGLGQSLNAGDALYALAFRALASDVDAADRRLETARLVAERVLEAIAGDGTALARGALEAGAVLAGARAPIVRAFVAAGELLATDPHSAPQALKDYVSLAEMVPFEEVVRSIARRST